MNLTAEQVSQFEKTKEEWKPSLYQQWKARGLDVSILPKPERLKRAEKASRARDPIGVGDFLKLSLEWTGIPKCQRCNKLMGEMNDAGPANVRGDVDYWSGRLVENLKGIAGDKAGDVDWWTEAKAKGALILLGEERAAAYAEQYILKACGDAEAVSGQQSEGERT